MFISFYRNNLENLNQIDEVSEIEDALPPLLMIDGQLFQGCDNFKQAPTDDADGTINEIVSNQNIPTKDQTANFGTEGMRYWYVPEGICIEVNGNYLLFKVTKL